MRRHSYDYYKDPKLREAVQYVRCGMPILRASTKTGISSSTIKKYYEKYKYTPSRIARKSTACKLLDSNLKQIFTPEQEITLIECFKYFQSLFYGLSEKECRMLAYQMLIKEDLTIPEGWKNGMATVEWLISFKKRYPHLHIERPTRCCRGVLSDEYVSWEKRNVSKFYDGLEKLIQEYPAFKDGTRIFSLDETYTSIDPKKKKACREDSKIDLVTTCCIVSASGVSLPPVIIKPHKTLTTSECSEIVPGTMTLTSLHGRMTPNLFAETMCHFVDHSKSSLGNPCILIMDTDLCHISSVAFDLAKSAGVHFLILHSHISRHLQPLEGGPFSLFRENYYAGMDSWLAEHGNKISKETALDLNKIIGDAYKKTMTPENIQNAFKNCGILPFDRDLFTDGHFWSRVVSDKACFECRSRQEIVQKPREQFIACSEKLDDPSNDLTDASETTAADSSLNTNQMTKNDREMSKQDKGTELDKLKRRMIRTVARLMKEKKSEEEVWQELKKESGTNCKTLWERMRSLTLKKLNRLLDVDDRVEFVPAVARMTLTDWLLYDLVIVHEKIDVIDKNKDSKVLSNLFSLVQRFAIEGRTGDDLAEAWTAATVSYNSKGHQCSPMLMQRRWYQLKEVTRSKLYKFWFCYRGNPSLLGVAKGDTPTALQRAVALRYPDIITKEFPDWEERIEQKLVVMPEEFEVKMRKKTLMKPSDENVPDVIVVERQIDTITLGDSDSENSNEENSGESTISQKDEISQTPVIVNVKTEPQDDYESIDTTDHSPYQQEKPTDRFQAEIDRLTLEEDQILRETSRETSEVEIKSEECTMPVITEVMGAVGTKMEDNIQDDVSGNEELEIINSHHNDGSNSETKGTTRNYELDVEKPIIIDNNYDKTTDTKTEGEIINSKEPDFIASNFDTQSQESIVIDDDDDDDDESILSKHMDQKENNGEATNENENASFGVKSIKFKQVTDVEMDDVITLENDNLLPIVEKIEIDEPIENDIFDPFITDEIASGSQIESKMEVGTRNLNDKVENVNDNIPPQDIETPFGENTTMKDPEGSLGEDFADDIISGVTFADEGIEFADDGIEYTDEDRNGLSESPALRGRENTVNEIGSTPKFDLKLLMNPVVYTTKLDEMTVYKDRSLFETIDEKELVDKIILESKPTSSKSINVEQVVEQGKEEVGNIDEVCDDVQVKIENLDGNEVDDDLFHNESSDESENDVIDESKKVKLSSNLLQKPRIRSYHPIQLCKNPDFNTRLKRLTIGFFSSPRNRAFFKACKPLTIDLSKTFESKLVNGTMYLKESDQVIEKGVENSIESAVSILPSAVAVQSLMDNETTDADKILQEELRKRVLERNKTINLPNISVVRQINQHLLMAEVAPMMTNIERSSSGHSLNIERNIKSVEIQNEMSFNSGPKRLKINPYVGANENSTVINKFKNSPQPNLKESTKCRDETSSGVGKQSLLVADNNDGKKSKLDKIHDKQKKKYERQTELPSWITKYSNYDGANDSLLTLDTLYKMLHALDPSSVQLLPVKQKQKKVQKKVPVKNFTSECNDNETNIEKTKIQDCDAPVDENKTKKQKYCCWSKTKIAKMTGLYPNLRVLKHKCPTGNCKCCCKELLRQKELDVEVKILESMQNTTDTERETIEHVIQQSRVFGKVSDPETHIVCDEPKSQSSRMVNVGLQANLDDDGTVQIIDGEPVPEKQIEKEITIDLDADEANAPALTAIQSPKPKIRVFSGSPSYLNSVPSPSQRAQPSQRPRTRTTNVQPITMSPTFVVHNSPPKPPPTNILTNVRKIAPKYVTMKPKHNFYSNCNDEEPCSCRPNVAVDKSAAMLVVDGSNECLRHTKSRVSKETRIYLNRKSMSSTERPFYVGKNKILLTNVTQPKLREPEPVSTTLPDGVQVALLPDGTITYLVDPGVELTPDQIDAMPAILSSIQAQINASGITLPADPLEKTVVSSSNDDAVSRPVADTAEVQNFEISNAEDEQNKANGDVNSTAPLDITQIADVSATTQDSRDEDNQKSSLNEPHCMPETIENTTNDDELSTSVKFVNKDNTATDAIDTENTVTSTEAATTENLAVAENEHNAQGVEKNATMESSETVESNHTPANSSRNLLSDLMEMSGILDEDIVPVQQQLQEHSVTPTLEPITQQMISHDPDSSLLQPAPMPEPELSSYTKNKHSISACIKDQMYELNPITSFAELRYACDNDGLFFKLDLSNGIIVPINVCIQKSPAETASTKPNIDPKEIIDLTDEQGNSINDETNTGVSPTTSDNTRYSTIMPRKLSSMLPVVPTDKNSLLRTTPLFVLQNNDNTISSIEQKKQMLLKRLSNNLKPLKILEKRHHNINILKKTELLFKTPVQKRQLSKIEAKIDLVDSDAPMEEEYLLEDSSEDSDDEPLAKIAKKKRDHADNQEAQRYSQNLQHSQAFVMPVDKTIDFEEAIDAIEAPDALHRDVIEPVPTQLVLSGSALNQPLPMLADSFQVANEADDEDSQDDCILGV